MAGCLQVWNTMCCRLLILLTNLTLKIILLEFRLSPCGKLALCSQFFQEYGRKAIFHLSFVFACIFIGLSDIVLVLCWSSHRDHFWITTCTNFGIRWYRPGFLTMSSSMSSLMLMLAFCGGSYIQAHMLGWLTLSLMSRLSSNWLFQCHAALP